MEINVVPQVVELVEEKVVIKDLVDHLTVVMDLYHGNKFVDRAKMHLAPSTNVNEYCLNLMPHL